MTVKRCTGYKGCTGLTSDGRTCLSCKKHMRDSTSNRASILKKNWFRDRAIKKGWVSDLSNNTRDKLPEILGEKKYKLLEKEYKAQPGEPEEEESTEVCINDLPALARHNNRKGEKRKKGKRGKTWRNGHEGQFVNNDHNGDQDLLNRILGVKYSILEEDWVDITVQRNNEIYEYKPNVDRGDLQKAEGKLQMASDNYYIKHGIRPSLGFITRRKLGLEDVLFFTSRGISVQYLTKNNRLVKA